MILILWAIGFFIAVYIYFFMENDRLPSSMMIVVICGLMIAILWAKLCVEVMVDFLIV